MIKKLFLLVLTITSCTKQDSKPPLAPSVIALDEYHGQKIEDPYRNLENLEDSTVIDWLKQQGDYAFNTIERIPGRQRLIDKQLKYDENSKFKVVSIKRTQNGKYFYLKRLAKENTYKLYYRLSLEQKEILLFDPSEYNKNEEYHINVHMPDWIGEKIAVSLSKKGDETSEIIVINIQAETILPHVLTKTLSKMQWLSDNSGFTYTYSPINDPTHPEYHMRTRSILYILGSDPKQLQDVFSKTNNSELHLKPEDYPYINNYDPNDGYLFAGVGGSSLFEDKYIQKEQSVFSKKNQWELLFKQEHKIHKIRVINDNYIFLSAKGASKNKICRTSIKNPNFNTPEILIPEKTNELINDFELTKDGLFFTTMKNGVEAKLYEFKNAYQKEIVLPRPSGTVKIISNGIDKSMLRITTSGYLNPDIDYLYNTSTNNFQIEQLKPDLDYSDFKDLIVENIEIPSHDGVLVPVAIVRNKNMKKNSDNYTLFFGYGSYGAASGASFNPSFLNWVLDGGVLVFSSVRGGGEKGEDWHKAGFKSTKPNTWKDMIATTEYLIKEGYTNPEKSAVWGTSAGGIMAGRAMTERPDLYRAVVLISPATNMLRSEIQPNGQNSIKEFGTVAIKEEFEALLEMDCYHHIQKGVKYPATYVMGGMKDGRVVIWDHSKFVARLQASNISDYPILFGVDFEDGHAGMHNSKLEIFEKYADIISFTFWQLGHPDYQPK